MWVRTRWLTRRLSRCNCGFNYAADGGSLPQWASPISISIGRSLSKRDADFSAFCCNRFADCREIASVSESHALMSVWSHALSYRRLISDCRRIFNSFSRREHDAQAHFRASPRAAAIYITGGRERRQEDPHRPREMEHRVTRLRHRAACQFAASFDPGSSE